MSTIKSSTEHLTLNADGSGKDIKFQANGVEKASISSTGAFTSTSIDATKLSGTVPNFTSTGIDDNATSTAITIDANENVGIGTATPSKDFVVSNAGAEGIEFDAGALANLNEMLSYNRSTSAYIPIRHSASEHQFYVNGAERMRIDSAGRVTMPYQPGFKAAWTSRSATGSGRILSTNASDTVTTGRDEYNTGSHFSTATGRFTAPVAGTYLLGFHGMRNGTNGSALECRIKKNGGYMWARAYQGVFDQAHQYWSIVTTTKCAAGDYFQVYIGPSTSIYNDDTYFYGHLLG
jgi:hypothetical protein